MKILFVQILYRSFWFSLISCLGIACKKFKHGRRIVPIQFQRLAGVLFSMWLALPVTVSMNIYYRAEVSFPKEKAVTVLDHISDMPVPSAPAQVKFPRFYLFNAVAAIWLLGAAAVFLYHIGGYIRTNRNLHRWRTSRMIQGMERPEEGRYKNVKIAYSLSANVPLTEGILHPVIWLPDSWKQADPKYALLHETTHLRQGDIWVKWLLLWVKSIYWFHPLIYCFSHDVSEILEYACDERAMRGASTETRIKYTLSILKASGKENYQKIADGILGLVGEKKQMVSRIEKIMRPTEESGSMDFRAKLGACFLAVLMAASVVSFHIKEKPQTVSAADNSINEEPASITIADSSKNDEDIDDTVSKKPASIKIADLNKDDEGTDDTINKIPASISLTDLNKDDENTQADIPESADAEDTPAEEPEAKEKQPVEFELEVFPCEAYRVAFPTLYKTSPEAVKKDLMFYANPGTKVYSVANETVIETGRKGYYGRYVLTESGNYQFHYSHLEEISVDVGDVLNQGSLIGTVGASGAVTHYMCELGIQTKDGNPADLSKYGKGYEW